MTPNNNPTTEYEIFSGSENFELAWQRLVRSTRYEVKDWLGLEVYGWTGHKEKHLELIRKNLSNFKPSAANRISVPKQDRSLRHFAFLTMDDRLIYQAIGNRIIAHSYDDLMIWVDYKKVFANVPTAPENQDGFVFRRTFSSVRRVSSTSTLRIIGQYDLFRREILKTRREMLDKYPSAWLIKTDISSYFPTINHKLLQQLIQERKWLPNNDILDLLIKCLNQWKFSSQDIGIPIGYETSDYIGNLYLFPVDEALEEFEVKRYVDDMYIFVPTFEDAKRALSILDNALAKLELQRNSTKTEFICLQDISEEDLLNKLSKSLSLLAKPRRNEISEAKRQNGLIRLFFSAYNPQEDKNCICTQAIVSDIRSAAFAMYRLKVPDIRIRYAALCILDTYPNYSFHAAEYLKNNYGHDDDIIAALRVYVRQKYEPTELKLNVLKALEKMVVGYRGIEDDIETIIKTSADWFLKYDLLRNIVRNNLIAIFSDYLADALKNESDMFVRSYLIQLAFLHYANVDARKYLIELAFQDQTTFINKLGIYLQTRFNIQNVDITFLHADLRNQFLDGHSRDEIQEFFDKFYDLFRIRLHPDFPIGKVFGDINHSLNLLRTAWGSIKQGANDFVRALVTLTENLLNAEIKVLYDNQSSLNLSELRASLYFSSDTITVDNTEKLEIDYAKIMRGEFLNNKRQEKLLKDDLYELYEYHINIFNRRYFGIPMREEIFISYSHIDDMWREKIQKFLKPHFRNKTITVWDDTHIKPGHGLPPV